MLLRSPIVALGALLLAAGCTVTGDADDAGAAMQARAGSLAIVQVEREAGEDDPDVATPRAVLGAAFARYRGLDGRAVIELLGGRAVPVGACALAGADGAAFAAPEAEVELMDVGDLEVRVAGTRTRLVPRAFPDLAGLVSGAFYAEDATLGPAVAEVDEYVVRADGSEAVPPFEVVVVAPPGFSEVMVDGVEAGAVDGLTRGEDVELAWDGGDPRDRVEIDVAAGGDVLQCVARDDGAFRVPGALLAELQGDEEARLVFRRVRQQTFDAEGVDTAWVSVATSRTIRLPVE